MQKVNKITKYGWWMLIVALIIAAIFSTKEKDLNVTTEIGNNPSDIIEDTKNVFDDNDGIDFVIVEPNVGYDTGISTFPKLTWKDKNIIDDSDHVNINVKYPQFYGDKNVINLNKYIENIIDTIIYEDRIQLKDLLLSDPDSFLSSIFLNSSYRVIGVENGIVSIELVITDFTGGGNGNHDFSFSINWDLKTDQLFKNDQIFCSKDYISKIASYSQKRLLDRMPEDFHISLYEDREVYSDVVQWIKEGTAPEIKNYSNLLLYNNGLFVIFQPYQVHSGASGIVRVYVPDSEIQGLKCL